MDPRNLRIEDFDYDLPPGRIASHPLAERDASRLLICKPNSIHPGSFRDISKELPSGSLIVFNNTRVVEARILFRKPTGAQIEIFCLGPADESMGIETALFSKGSITWRCLVGNASGWPKATPVVRQLPEGQSLTASVAGKNDDYFLVHFSWSPASKTFEEMLHLAGTVPLPPYIKRKPESSDLERYQTIYADKAGSVAAPTAGLHFTPEILDQLAAKNIKKEFVTLHVGAGTFKPVRSETMGGHEMHTEYIGVRRELVEALLANADNKITAVGTTSLRTLESLFWIGRKLLRNPNAAANELGVTQWEAYDVNAQENTSECLRAILTWMNNRNVDFFTTKTALLIVPSYQFRIVDILITNFHQPRSTLLLLVAAFCGDNWKNAYTFALDNDFRFLSYGDACLMFRQ